MALAREVLAEVPQQVCDYMRLQDIHPKGYVDQFAAHERVRAAAAEKAAASAADKLAAGAAASSTVLETPVDGADPAAATAAAEAADPADDAARPRPSAVPRGQYMLEV